MTSHLPSSAASTNMRQDYIPPLLDAVVPGSRETSRTEPTTQPSFSPPHCSQLQIFRLWRPLFLEIEEIHFLSDAAQLVSLSIDYSTNAPNRQHSTDIYIHEEGNVVQMIAPHGSKRGGTRVTGYGRRLLNEAGTGCVGQVVTLSSL
ncbi:uncharacterized protein BDZ99DRAFT_470779 [Mytilinidion resinicola]|uniref:Uncharacterized protein n=1 Tax=Mytilinidion resinicola TaxID=574789 RepID=A0A6A6ZBY5_9PEZI|nr:uncharacterized protein BDZ99DRAFT_470779 [Mytilinidion resinicola]KAF2817825.1 hypothetical protein BDZ99DRAFT_470779 [Mytilinidion resinicola]